ncbi:hypothetical protein AB8O53_20235 [Streptomyces pilosus]
MSDIVTRPHTAESGTATPTPGDRIRRLAPLAPQARALFTICVMAANPAPAPAANGDLGA